MEELVQAVAAKLRREPNFMLCQWDEDFEEFVDGVKVRVRPASLRRNTVAITKGGAYLMTHMLDSHPLAAPHHDCRREGTLSPLAESESE
jgi:hypothetical protein